MEPGFLNQEDQWELLRIARRTLEVHLNGAIPREIRSELPNLQIPTGAFVTLHKQGQLRGCIGHLHADHPLYATVVEMAIAAATQDPRFPPVQAEELKEIDIEISVLSPFREIQGLEEIEVGRHGLIASRGAHRGLLLPQVAAEYGWDSPTFLSYTCLKAGLPADAWKDGSVKVEVFSAQVFGEKSLGEV
jgi:AmmeMemoRadiSam system protein A